MWKEDDKAKSGNVDRVDQETAHPNEPKKMQKEHAEAAAEELSRKKIEISEVRERKPKGTKR